MSKKTNRLAAATATIATLAGGAMIQASPASAALTTQCVGEGGAVTVPGDLVVPRGQTCTLAGTTVEGDVRVEPGANLIATSAAVNGRLTVRTDGWTDLTETTVGGRVALVDSYGYYSEDARLNDNIVIRRTDETLPSGMLLSFDSSIAGNVVAGDGDVTLEGTTVEGNVNGREAMFVDVLDSVVEGRLRVSGTPEGSIVCDSEIYGDARFENNGGMLQLGGPGANGDCTGADYWGGNLAIEGNAGGVSLHDNIVRGNVGGEGNDPAPTGADNRFRGDVSGQFVDLAPTMSTARSRTAAATASAAAARGDRTEQSERAAAQRTKEAVAEASRIGPADL